MGFVFGLLEIMRAKAKGRKNRIRFDLSVVVRAGFGRKVIPVRVICESHPTSHWEIFSFRMEIVLNRDSINKIIN